MNQKRQFISLFFYLFSLSIFSQELIGIHVDHEYYNGVIFNDKFIVNSNFGLLEYSNGKFIPYSKNDSKFKRFIKVREGKIIDGDIFYNKKPAYEKVFPNEFSNLKYTITYFEDKAFIFVKKSVLIYKNPVSVKKTFDKNVSSISKKLYSTTSGIYNRKLELQENLLKYQGGKIKDISNGIAICYGGLFIDKNEKIFEFSDSDNNFKIGEKTLGKARDITEVNSNEFIVSTTLGVYLIDIYKNTSFTILESEEDFVPKVKKSENGTYLISNYNTLYEFNLNTLKALPLYTNELYITDFLLLNNNSLLYVISTDKLEEIELINNKKHVLIEDLKAPLNLVNILSFLVIISEDSISLFNLNSDSVDIDVFKDKYNNDSYFVEENILQIGLNNGVVYFYEDSFVSESFLQKFHKLKSNKTDNSSIIYLNIIFLTIIFLLIGILIFLINKKVKTKDAIIKTATDFSLEEKVKKYVQNNISNVTVAKIKEQFEINNMYELFEDITPGDYIRTQRVKIVKEMRKQNSSEQEISKATGFSVSYLKKI